MEFGFALPQSGRFVSPETIAFAAQEAERAGYAALWVVERWLRPLHPRSADNRPPIVMPESYAMVYDPLDTLAYVAATTQHIKLGTSVIDALFHPPVLLARRLATVDHLSKGRLIVGLGQGYAPEEFAAANVPLSRRGAGFEEYITVLRTAWGPDPVSFSGRFYDIAESQLGPKPLQPGGPPLLIAAMEPRAIDRAARLGAGFHPLIPNWETFEQGVKQFRAAAHAAGHDPAQLPVVVRTNTTVSDQPLAEPRPPLSGAHEQVVEDLRRLQNLGVNHIFFDMNRYNVPVDQQFRIMERLRTAVA